MPKLSKAQRVLRLLERHKSLTSFEVSTYTGWTVRLASAHLFNLRGRKKIVSVGQKMHSHTGRPCHVWQLVK